MRIEKIHKNIAKRRLIVFRFSQGSLPSSYKTRYFAKVTFVSADTSRGQLKSSIAVRAERFCTHTPLRERSLNTLEIDKDKPACTVDKFSLWLVKLFS